MIKKIGKGKYRVISHSTGRNLGTFSSKAKAKKRLRQVSRFKKKR